MCTLKKKKNLTLTYIKCRKQSARIRYYLKLVKRFFSFLFSSFPFFSLSRPHPHPPLPRTHTHTPLCLSLFLSQFWSFKQKTRDPFDLIIFGGSGRTVSCTLEAMLSMIFRLKNTQQETVDIDLNFKVKTWSQRVFNGNLLLGQGCHIKHIKIED